MLLPTNRMSPPRAAGVAGLCGAPAAGIEAVNSSNIDARVFM
jgi:hypothetical protein